MELSFVLECKLSEMIIIMQHSSAAIWNSQVGSINPFKAKTFASFVQQLHVNGFRKSQFWTTDQLSINIFTPTLKWKRPELFPPLGRWTRFPDWPQDNSAELQNEQIPLGTWSSKKTGNPVGITQVVGPQALNPGRVSEEETGRCLFWAICVHAWWPYSDYSAGGWWRTACCWLHIPTHCQSHQVLVHGTDDMAQCSSWLKAWLLLKAWI